MKAFIEEFECSIMELKLIGFDFVTSGSIELNYFAAIQPSFVFIKLFIQVIIFTFFMVFLLQVYFLN